MKTAACKEKIRCESIRSSVKKFNLVKPEGGKGIQKLLPFEEKL